MRYILLSLTIFLSVLDVSRPFGAEILNQSWAVKVAGQIVQVNADGSFLVPNISSVDNFGSDGPGTPRDGLSDDFYQLTGTQTQQGRIRYVFSERFRILQGGTYQVKDLTFMNTPPGTYERIRAVLDKQTLNGIGTTTQMRVTGWEANGTSRDATSRLEWTVYRTSNPQIATIDQNGLVTARGTGMVFLTAVNDGATSVARLVIVPGDPLTTLVGVVNGPNGEPLAGANVRITGLPQSVTAGADGRFVIEDIPTTLGVLTLVATYTDGGTKFTGFTTSPRFVLAGVTDVGTISTKVPSMLIAAGGTHALAIRPEGTLWAWGGNNAGQLGIGDNYDRLVPIQVGSSANWESITAGGGHTLGLRTDGTLWAWGLNQYGQLGIGTTIHQSAPVQVLPGTTWRAVSAGSDHTLAIRNDGTLWAWGLNAAGTLGIGFHDHFQPHPNPIQVGTATWRTVAACEGHSFAVRNDGTLWGWGVVTGSFPSGWQSEPRQIGTASDWIAVAPGQGHVLAIRGDGSVWGWGANTWGQVGDGTKVDRGAPVRVGIDNDWQSVVAGQSISLGIRKDGTLWIWGISRLPLGNASVPKQIGVGPAWQSAAGSFFPRMAVRADGSIWVWGHNEYGQFGDGTDWKTERTRPVQIGVGGPWDDVSTAYDDMAAVRSDGTVWVWGRHNAGVLGDGTLKSRLSPLQVGSGTNWQTVSTGNSHTTALRDDSTLWGWGYDGFSFNLIPTQIESDADWRMISAGSYHTLALRFDGTLWGWGENYSGQLGLGNTGSSFNPGPLQIGTDTDWETVSAGLKHSIGVFRDGSLWAWGDNSLGQLGDGTTSSRLEPVLVGTDASWKEISAGGLHTLALRKNGTLWAWGDNTYGQLGDGSTVNRLLPIQVGVGIPWQALAAGIAHSVAVRADGTLWAWGANWMGQLGDGTTETRLNPVQIETDADWQSVSVGSSHTRALRTDGTLWAWGANYPRIDGTGTPGEAMSEVRLESASLPASPPRIRTQPRSQNIPAEDPVTISVQARGTEPLMFEWFFNGQRISESNPVMQIISSGRNSEVRITSATLGVQGQFHVRITNDLGSIESNPAQLTVEYSPPWITHQPDDVSVLIGQRATFTVRASGGPRPTFQWSFNGTPIPNATASTFTIPAVSAANVGNYTVKTSNPSGFDFSRAARLTLARQDDGSLQEALDDPALTWITGGASTWIAQTQQTSDGEDAARSGAVLGEQKSWIETVVPGEIFGAVNFRWKVSSEQWFDYVMFSVNGIEYSRIYGETDWIEESIPVYELAPFHLRWTYIKDGFGSSGHDAAWLDQVNVQFSE